MCREGLGGIPRDGEGERWGWGRLWRQHEPRHEAGGENVCVRLAMLGVTGNNVELGRVGSETWVEFGVDGVAHRLVSLGEKG